MAAALEGNTDRVAWMPAHCTEAQVQTKKLSNGEQMTEGDFKGNDMVDKLAKQIAKWDTPPNSQIVAVRAAGERLAAIATWIGQIGAFANKFPLPRESADIAGKVRHIRDSEGHKPAAASASSRKGRKRKAQAIAAAPSFPGDFSLCPRCAALRQRILAKERLRESNPDQ